ncbi:Cytochrome P450 [Macleaya cordata]|uniref:Cytochrome P450 n=1 Tax=Macleaya cordata TaxID=56857 RepID=A0A200QIZ2_MACCD|nr:Cytochrome P450 [Macleaya cordata]
MTVFCGAAGNRFLFSNERKLVNVWWPPFVDKIFYSSQQSLIEQEEAKKFRKLTNQFHKLVNVGLMDSMTRTHFENRWDNEKEVTVYPLVKNYTFSLACWSLLGINDQARVDELIKPFSMVTVGIISIPIDLPGTPFNRALKASKLIRKELLSIVNQRKMDLTSSSEKNNDASPKQDLLSQIILFSNDGKDTYKVMNEKEIADKILGLLIGGHDSVSVVITSVMKYLAELPDVYNEVLRGK